MQRPGPGTAGPANAPSRTVRPRGRRPGSPGMRMPRGSGARSTGRGPAPALASAAHLRAPRTRAGRPPARGGRGQLRVRRGRGPEPRRAAAVARRGVQRRLGGHRSTGTGSPSLVLEAHLHARQVQLVRAACQYLRQAGLGASPSYVRGILSAHREFVRHWVEVFEQRFDPGVRCVRSSNRLATYADAATTRDEFRVLDWYAALLDAVTRTNYFRLDAPATRRSRSCSSSTRARLPFPTDPAVQVETFVHHPDVEGLHVRYGAVARGGLRWSDRVEDYRDEVLALAKAQQVKNSLIVPAGAKGAFVVKASLAGLSRRGGGSRRCAAATGSSCVACSTSPTTSPATALPIRRACVVTDGRRPLPGGGRGQGHRGLLGPGERGVRRRGLLARRRVRLRRVHRLQPQAAGSDCPRCLGGRTPTLHRARHRPGARRVHRRGHRRHVRGRLRQRDAALGPAPPGRRVRPSAHLPGPRPRTRGPRSRSGPGWRRCRGPRGPTTTLR